MTSAAITVHQFSVFVNKIIVKVKGVTALISLRTTALTLKRSSFKFKRTILKYISFNFEGTSLISQLISNLPYTYLKPSLNIALK